MQLGTECLEENSATVDRLQQQHRQRPALLSVHSPVLNTGMLPVANLSTGTHRRSHAHSLLQRRVPLATL